MVLLFDSPCIAPAIIPIINCIFLSSDVDKCKGIKLKKSQLEEGKQYTVTCTVESTSILVTSASAEIKVVVVSDSKPIVSLSLQGAVDASKVLPGKR